MRSVGYGRLDPYCRHRDGGVRTLLSQQSEPLYGGIPTLLSPVRPPLGRQPTPTQCPDRLSVVHAFAGWGIRRSTVEPPPTQRLKRPQKGRQSVMRGDSNKIAMRAIRNIFDGARPFEIQVADRRVTCVVSRSPGELWPEEGLEGLDAEADGPQWPASIEVDCQWQDGRCQLLVSCRYRTANNQYYHQVGILVRSKVRARALLWITVPAAIGDAEDGSTVAIPGAVSTVQRKADPPDVGRRLNDAMREVLRDSGLPIITGSNAEVCSIEIPSGSVRGSAEVAFKRLVQLALLKRDFVDRGGYVQRDRLIDLGKWGIHLDQTAEEPDEDEGDEAYDESAASASDADSFWKIAPDAGGALWPMWLQDGVATIGWPDLGDLSTLDQAGFEKRVREYQQQHPGQNRGSLERVWRFRHIPTGARIVANRGTSRVLGLGTVTGPYFYAPGHEHAHRLPVRWDDTREREVQRGGWRKALLQLTRQDFAEISALEPVNTPKAHLPPTTGEGLDFESLISRLKDLRLSFPSELVASYILALQTKRFVILSGISGTGKTQLARFVADTFGAGGSVHKEHESDSTAHKITVKPYMLKHNRIWLPVDFLADAPFLVERASESAPADRRIAVLFGEHSTEGRIWRQGDSSLIGVFWPRTFSQRMASMLAEGDTLTLEAEERQGRLPALRFATFDYKTRPPLLPAVSVVAVRPDWTDNRGLLGFYNPIIRTFQPSPFLRLLLAARRDIDLADHEQRSPRPFFAVLDEMNLARVEHYFSDFLSCVESGQPIHLHDDLETEEREGIPQRVSVPRNLFFTGTINVDETTYIFSPKVLDRAFTLEFNQVSLEDYGKETSLDESRDDDDDESPLWLHRFTGALEIRENPKPEDWVKFRTLAGGQPVVELQKLNTILAREHRHFGYRVANEIARFVNLAVAQGGEREVAIWAALDVAILAKVLPKLHGTQQELDELLQSLEEIVSPQEEPTRFPRTAAKIRRMLTRLRQQGHTSFIE